MFKGCPVTLQSRKESNFIPLKILNVKLLWRVFATLLQESEDGKGARDSFTESWIHFYINTFILVSVMQIASHHPYPSISVNDSFSKPLLITCPRYAYRALVILRNGRQAGWQVFPSQLFSLGKILEALEKPKPLDFLEVEERCTKNISKWILGMLYTCAYILCYRML